MAEHSQLNARFHGVFAQDRGFWSVHENKGALHFGKCDLNIFTHEVDLLLQRLQTLQAMKKGVFGAESVHCDIDGHVVEVTRFFAWTNPQLEESYTLRGGPVTIRLSAEDVVKLIDELAALDRSLRSEVRLIDFDGNKRSDVYERGSP